MALIPSESPNILVKEFDLSGVVPAVTSTTGALVGDFNWGPVEATDSYRQRSAISFYLWIALPRLCG